MNKVTKTGFCGLSDEMFNAFFLSDSRVTEKIINSLLSTELTVDLVTGYELPHKEFGYSHPFVIVDAHNRDGRCAIAMTVMTEEVDDDLSRILNWILDYTISMRKGVYPILVSFDMGNDGIPSSTEITISCVDSLPVNFALAVCWMKTKMKSGRKMEELYSDLMSVSSDSITDDDIRRVYLDAYERSGLSEKEKLSYSLWLASLKKDIESLGVDPSFIV